MNITSEQWAEIAAVLPGEWERGEGGWTTKRPVWVHELGYVLDPPRSSCGCGKRERIIYWTAHAPVAFSTLGALSELGDDPVAALRNLRARLRRHAEMLADFTGEVGAEPGGMTRAAVDALRVQLRERVPLSFSAMRDGVELALTGIEEMRTPRGE